MRRITAALVLATALSVACSSDQAIQQQVVAPSYARGPNGCLDVDSLRLLITTLFPDGQVQGPTDRLNQILDLLAAGKSADAQAVAFDLVKLTLASFHAGSLNGGTSSGTQANVVLFVDGVFCTAGVASTLPPGALDPDGAAEVITPGSPGMTVVTSTLFAGAQVNQGATPQSTLFTIRRLPDSPPPLLTPLDQFPLFYEFTAGPTVSFNQDVLLGVCQPANVTAPDPSRLRVAHNIAPFTPGSIEILPLAPAPFLDCTAAAQIGLGPVSRWLGNLGRLLSPRPLYAMVGNTGVGGTTKKLSPFGAVDTLARMDATILTKVNGIAGMPLGDRPSVVVKTLTGRPMPGITVVFAVSSGGGSVSGGTVITDANGNAKLGSWILGATPGTNTLLATAIRPQGAGFQNSPILFTAIGKKKP